MKNITIKTKKNIRKKKDIERYWYKFSRNPLSVLGLITILLILFAGLFAPYLTPYSDSAGNYIDFVEANKRPSLMHIGGTDVFGRDIFARILFGTRLSLLMGITVLSIAVPIGVTAGLVAGYFRGRWISLLIMRIVDIFVAVPPLLLALVVCSILTPGVFNAMIAVSVSWWAYYARMVYGIVSSIRGEFYVQAVEVS